MTIQPIKVPQDYINWSLTTDRGIMAHLYQFESAVGALDYFTDLDIDVDYNNIVWKATSLRFEGLHRKLSVGLSVDEQDMKIWAKPTDTLFGANFLSGAANGLMDGAIITRMRVVWPFVTGNARQDILYSPKAAWTLFTGYVSKISKLGTSHAELKVKSAIHKLDVNMPRNYWQPGCLWTLFDAGCGLNKALFAVDGLIGAGVTGKVLPISGGIAVPVGPDGNGNYAQGRLLFTSGANNGLLTLIDSNDSANLYLAYVLTTPPSVGDQVTFYPGCAKTFNTCDVKFNNKNNFRGFDKVPPVMVSV